MKVSYLPLFLTLDAVPLQHQGLANTDYSETIANYWLFWDNCQLLWLASIDLYTEGKFWGCTLSVKNPNQVVL